MEKLEMVIVLVFLIIFLCGDCDAQGKSDYHALIAFKASSDINNSLASSWTHKNPCRRRWYGVGCENGRVVRIVLQDLDLVGPIDALAGLHELRVLSLKRNSLNGTIPDLLNWRSLKFLFLSENHFSGPLPSTITSLDRLLRVDVSNNQLSGPIPSSLTSLTHLLTLRLDNNEFSGSISDLMLPNTVEEFNVSDNRLSGLIPASLSRFPSSGFVNNEALCGSPLQSCKESNNASSDSNPYMASSPSMISASLPSQRSNSSRQLSKGDIIAIVVGDVAVLSIIGCVIFCYYWKRKGVKQKKPKPKPTQRCQTDKLAAHSSDQCPNNQSNAAGKCKLIFFDIGRPFELEHLLRASAEMLGKGNFGSAYKAIMEDGSVVAVKRLKDVHGIGKKEFEQHMELMGSLRHQNVVNLRAYYYARDEKLLVYDYMPNGSLYALLHGSRGPGRTPLDWTTRLKIALGAAKGLAFIHSHCKSPKIGHGNIKSSNILLDRNGNACISDFGLALIVSPSVAASRMVGYMAPEQAATKKISQKADVYSFGVLLLEMLTGKAPVQSHMQDDYHSTIDLPRWVQSIAPEEWTSEVFDIELMRFKNIEEELVSMLQISLLCASQSPQQRPKMSHVVRMIQDVRGDHQSPSMQNSQSQSPSMHEHGHSISDSPSVSEDSGLRGL